MESLGVSISRSPLAVSLILNREPDRRRTDRTATVDMAYITAVGRRRERDGRLKARRQLKVNVVKRKKGGTEKSCDCSRRNNTSPLRAKSRVRCDDVRYRSGTSPSLPPIYISLSLSLFTAPHCDIFLLSHSLSHLYKTIRILIVSHFNAL